MITRRQLTVLLPIVAVLMNATLARAGGKVPQIQLETAQEVLSGRLLAHDKTTCYLLQQDGQMAVVKRSEVHTFQRMTEPFRPTSIQQLKQQLTREFPRPYKILADKRYVVVAQKEIVVDCLQAFNDVDRAFRSYFAHRSIPLETAEFPLVAVVLRNFDDFTAYASFEGINTGGGLVGYYLPTSNRVALFNTASESTALIRPVRQQTHIATRPSAPLRAVRATSPKDRLDKDLYDTIVHEATHQMAYNTGLHSRVGDDPLWVIEGLATLFESDELRTHVRNQSVASRVNRYRLNWFRRKTRPNWQHGLVAELIASDDLFTTRPLDAYALSWALTFYINETQPHRYADWLRWLRERDRLAEYPAAQRLADFQSIFGHDLALLETTLIRFIENLDVR